MNDHTLPTQNARSNTFPFSQEGYHTAKTFGNDDFTANSTPPGHTYDNMGTIDLTCAQLEPGPFSLIAAGSEGNNYDGAASDVVLEDGSEALQSYLIGNCDPPTAPNMQTLDMEPQLRDMENQIWSLRQSISHRDSFSYSQLGFINSQISAMQAQHQGCMRYVWDLHSQRNALHVKVAALETKLLEIEQRSRGILLIQETFRFTPEYIRMLLDQHSQHESEYRQARWNWQSMHKALKTVHTEHQGVASKVDDHEAENAHLHGRLQEFLGHVTGGLGEVAQFIQTRFPDAPAFNGVQSLLDLDGTDAEDEEQHSGVSAVGEMGAPTSETGR